MIKRAKESMAVQVRAMLEFHSQGIPVFRLRQQYPPDGAGSGRGQCIRFSRLCPRLYPPAVLPGRGSLRWAALSGEADDIYRTDAKVKELIPDNRTCITGWTRRGRK